jgi:hypothetical protein
VWWLITDLLALWQRAPELTIDTARVNAELRRSALGGDDDDVIYRERVKRRMRDGARGGYPPLIDRSRLRSSDAFRLDPSMREDAAASARPSGATLEEWYGLQ